eukprot:TRINITY_DN105597_c0_g1_i1.p1 TRINITY_DN105597_c0_g1~~TRINITY_DN105597_c0_g1_i1.p1  ORF type:complete len:229 (-),score=52.91 TRINITY_DN105597_c0_g1_i1:80-697(-)
MPKLTLTYFDFGGRAEGTRLAAAIGGVELEDKRLKPEEFGKAKAEGAFKFGSVPTLEVDGVQFGQSMAILKYVGSQAGLYPADPVQQLTIDQLLWTLEGDLFAQAPKQKDPEEKKKARREFATTTFQRFLGPLNKVAEANGSGWYVGDNITIADLSIYSFCAFLRTGMFDHVSMEDLAPFPALLKIDENVAKHPKVVAYYEARKK